MSRAKTDLIGYTGTILMLMVVVAMLLPATGVMSVTFTPRSAAVDDRPNIVLITMDDMRADELRYMPNVRRLIGDEGFRFTRAYSTLPQCCPARASLLTGQYAHNHGVMSNYFRFGGGYEQYLRSVDLADRSKFGRVERALARELTRLQDCKSHGCNRRFSLQR